MVPNSAAVVAARVLLLHGLSDDVIAGYIARTWALDGADCDAALASARALLRREHTLHAS